MRYATFGSGSAVDSNQLLAGFATALDAQAVAVFVEICYSWVAAALAASMWRASSRSG